MKTDKTKVVELIVLSISGPVALRDHFLNDVLWPKYFSYNLDFFWTWKIDETALGASSGAEIKSTGTG